MYLAIIFLVPRDLIVAVGVFFEEGNKLEVMAYDDELQAGTLAHLDDLVEGTS
jgi:hypothetical protein